MAVHCGSSKAKPLVSMWGTFEGLLQFQNFPLAEDLLQVLCKPILSSTEAGFPFSLQVFLRTFFHKTLVSAFLSQSHFLGKLTQDILQPREGDLNSGQEMSAKSLREGFVQDHTACKDGQCDPNHLDRNLDSPFISFIKQTKHVAQFYFQCSVGHFLNFCYLF